MNIRRKLQTIVALSSVVALIAAGMLYYSNQITGQIEHKTALSQNLVKDIAQLSMLAFYATQPEGDSAREQWMNKQETVIRNLESTQVDWNRAEIGHLRNISDMIGLIRNNMEESAHADGSLLPDYERRLDGQIIIFSQAIAADSRELATKVLTEGKVHRERANRIFLPFTILLTLGVPAITVRIYLTITRSLRQLQGAVERLQQGDFSHRTKMTAKDELGALGVAFDSMTASIQDSHASLSREIAARRASEDEVRRLNAELEQRVAARTAELVAVQAELNLAQQREREARYLEQSSQSETVDSRIYIPLRQSAPDAFASLVLDYKSLMAGVLQQELYQTKDEATGKKEALVDRLGRLRAGPRDVMEMHIQGLNDMTQDLSPQKRHAYMEEARYLILEIMGKLTAYYRNITMAIPTGEHTP